MLWEHLDFKIKNFENFKNFASNPVWGVALYPRGPFQLWPLSWPQFSWGGVIDFSHLYSHSSLIMIDFLGFVITVMLGSIKSHVARTQFCKTRNPCRNVLALSYSVSGWPVWQSSSIHKLGLSFPLQVRLPHPDTLFNQAFFFFFSLQNCFLSLIKTSNFNLWWENGAI